MLISLPQLYLPDLPASPFDDQMKLMRFRFEPPAYP